MERVRLSPLLEEFLENHLVNNSQHESERNNRLTVRQRILVCLSFLADNGFFHLIGDAQGASKATVHRCVKRVVRAVNDALYNELVLWPNRK